MEVTLESGVLLVLLVLFAVDKAMGFLKSRGVDLLKMARQIERLDEIITRTDDDGAPIVYVRRALQTAIEDLSKSIQSQTELLKAFQHTLGELLKRPCMQEQAVEAGGK